MELNPKQNAALDLDAHVSLAAGAGTGKTSVLVGRYVKIIGDRRAGVNNILAITFTEKAAAEMKVRVRAELERKAAASSKDAKAAGFWEDVLDDFREPHISTFHALCASMLREFPIEAGIDPAFTVLDGAQSASLIAETVDSLVDRAVSSGDARLATLAALWGRRKITEALSILAGKKSAARKWAAAYADADQQQAEASMRALTEMWSGRALDRERIGALLGRLRAVSCFDDTDALAPGYHAAVHALEALSRGDMNALSGLVAIVLRGGKKASWSDVDELKAAIKESRELAKDALPFLFTAKDAKAAAAARAIASLFSDMMAAFDEAKGGGVTLDFDDLEEKARSLLENSPSTRNALAARYRFILVDEFQDTNDAQWHIVKQLSGEKGGALKNNVFIVGDEKQSIYSFRGADVSIFNSARKEIDSANGSTSKRLTLDICYRSHPALIGFFNKLFERVFESRAADFLPEMDYFSIEAGRSAADRDDVEPVVEVILNDAVEREESFVSEEDAETPEERIAAVDEAFAAASRIAAMTRNGSGEFLYKDIAILFQSRTRLDDYKRALRGLGIPFTIVGGFGFYECREILDLVNILSYLAHPCDDVALAGALRSPLFGLSDEDLVAISMKDGGFFIDKLTAAASDAGLPGAQRIAAAHAMLMRWKAIAGRTPAGELLKSICDDSGFYGVLAAGPRREQSKRNVEKLFDIAHRFEQGGSGSLPKFVDYINEMIESGALEPEAALPDENLDAVRLMTVHAAKGLEFSVVVLAGMSKRYNFTYSDSLFLHEVRPGTTEAGFTVPDPDEDFTQKPSTVRNILKEIRSAKTKDEMKRLFYVACTRAKEKLIFAGAGANAVDNEKSIDACSRWDELLFAAMREARISGDENGGVRIFDSAGLAQRDINAAASAKNSDLPARFADIARMRDDVAMRDPDFVKYAGAPPCDAGAGLEFTVTEVLSFEKDESAHRERYVFGMPAEWEKRRGGAAKAKRSAGDPDPLMRGEIVHRLFEMSSTTAPGDEENLLKSLLAEHGVTDAEAAGRFAEHYLPRLKSMAESQLGRTIAGAPKHRELAFEIPVGRHRLRGVIDLLFNDDGMWHVLDYKTDKISVAQMTEADDGYIRQVELYALAVMETLPGMDRVSVSMYYIEPGLRGKVHVIDAARAARIKHELGGSLERMEQAYLAE